MSAFFTLTSESFILMCTGWSGQARARATSPVLRGYLGEENVSIK